MKVSTGFSLTNDVLDYSKNPAEVFSPREESRREQGKVLN